jgi:hypothetical protein
VSSNLTPKETVQMDMIKIQQKRREDLEHYEELIEREVSAFQVAIAVVCLFVALGLLFS